jgi:SM-20-related protein
VTCPLPEDAFASGPVPSGQDAGATRQAILAAILDGLAEKGWHVQAGFLPEPLVRQLRVECLARDAAGGFHVAGVGSGRAQVVSEVRGDRILWLEDGDPCPAVRAYQAVMEDLRQGVNAAFFLGLFELEAHFAAYPAGACYRRHLDRFKDDDRRSLTAIVYLNQDWTESDGGQLRFWPDEAGQAAPMDILPVGGTLVTFLSDRFWHQVLPASRQRLAITGWFKRR